MVQKIEPHNNKNEVSMTLIYIVDYMTKIFIPSNCFILLYGKELLYKHEHYTKVGPQPDDDSLHKKGPKQGIAKDGNRTSCFINSTILMNGLAILWQHIGENSQIILEM